MAFTMQLHATDLIASGGQGAVYRCEQADGNQVAIKVFHHASARSALREVTAMTRIANRHPHIVACFGEGSVEIARGASAPTASQRSRTDTEQPVQSAAPSTTTVPVISLEYIRGGDLLSAVHASGRAGLAVGDMSSTQAGAAQLASAIAFCHAHGVAHRDIKPENVMLCNTGDGKAPSWKLTDFGAASTSRVDPSRRKTPPSRIESGRPIGSAAYSAPEVVALMAAPGCSTKPTTPDYEVYGVDVWSFGVTLFVAASGCVPFQRAAGSDAAFLGFCAATQAQVLSPRAAQLAPEWRWPSHFSAGLVQVLTACLQVDPQTRPSMATVCALPWLAEGTKHIAYSGSEGAFAEGLKTGGVAPLTSPVADVAAAAAGGTSDSNAAQVVSPDDPRPPSTSSESSDGGAATPSE